MENIKDMDFLVNAKPRCLKRQKIKGKRDKNMEIQMIRVNNNIRKSLKANKSHCASSTDILFK